MKRKRRPLSERFWSHVDTSGECWLWMGTITKAGYGTARDEAWKGTTAHRLAWQLTNGPLPPGMIACHRCDNRRCVRPDHLFLGTYQDNTDDMMAKGRHRTTPHGRPGERHHNALLTAEQVVELRQRYAAGGISQRLLGLEYGIGQAQTGRIIRGDRWGSVT